MTDKPLTIERLEEMLSSNFLEVAMFRPILRQLLATLQREEWLKYEMKIIARPALGGKQQQYRAQGCLKQLYPNE